MKKFWTKHGEPLWVEIPAGKGMETFKIALTPVTNEQYKIFKPEWEVPEGKGYPVVNVSWNDAVAYCVWLSAAIGEKISLPTEAQWEFSAAGTEGREYPWGDEFDSAKCNCWNSSIGGTSPVGDYPDGATPEGILDMAGNVWEWCSSKWAEEGSARVLRGGSWYDDPEGCRSAFRGYYDPYYRGGDVGFRVAASP